MSVIHQMGNAAITYIPETYAYLYLDFLTSNVLGLCKDVLLRFINIPKLSFVQVSDAKAMKNGYKILVTGVKFLAFWTL
jgi:hypothetical protein